ncbi:hypothetical protein FK531_14550 [Rhodococcus spelaei]|uniref:Uncharacterized protein n=1 Tax=Rhodococcus spelaei TaxID=2546320 RepID=A0A541B7M0_9NOCA|nr:hypothetical protein FK531_14550 [Rhodococcus spelaei]
MSLNRPAAQSVVSRRVGTHHPDRRRDLRQGRRIRPEQPACALLAIPVAASLLLLARETILPQLDRH